MCCTGRGRRRRSVRIGASDLGRRVRVLWQGAEYRGRGRETLWEGKLTVAGNRIARFAPVNFLNPEREVQRRQPGTALAWTSVTTGNLAGIDLWLDEAQRGHAQHRDQCRVGHGRSCSLADNTVAFDGGGLGRQLSVYRLPESDWSRRVALEHTVTLCRRRRPAGLPARDAGRRPSGLDQSDLPYRVNLRRCQTGQAFSHHEALRIRTDIPRPRRRLETTHRLRDHLLRQPQHDLREIDRET